MTASNDLVLMERVFLRVGSANTDEQLQNAIGKFLPPVLLKLSSQQDGVRTKVLEFLVHVNKRLKSRPDVQLPVDTLLQQYQDESVSSFVTNFTIIYIKLGFPRLTRDRQVELLPTVFNCLNGKPTKHLDSLLFMILPALSDLKIPSDPQMRKLVLSGVNNQPGVIAYILEYMLDVLLLPYGVKAVPSNASSDVPAVPTPPGLSESSFKSLTVVENPLDAAALEKVKLGLVKFLCSGAFDEISILPHLVIGSSDTRHSVTNCAEMELRRKASDLEWNNPEVISKLFSIFLGTVVSKKKTNVNPDQKRTPVNTRIRMKIFPQLLKSKESAIQFPACVQVIFESLFGEKSNLKLKLFAVQYIHHVCDYCNIEQFIPISGVLLSGVIQLIDSKNVQDEKIRVLAYVAIGKIGQKSPSQVTSDMILITRLFKALSEETLEIKLATQQTLSMLANTFRNLSGTNKKIMEVLILNSIEEKEPQLRLASVQYASIIFSDDHITSRYCLLLASGDNKEEVCFEAMKALHIHAVTEKITQTSKQAKFPNFKDMFSFIKEKAEERIKSPHLKYTSGARSLAFYPAVYVNIVTYLNLCLASSAGVQPTAYQEDSLKQIPIIRRFFKSSASESRMSDGCFEEYLDFILQLLITTKNASSMRHLLEGIAISPTEIVKSFVNHMDLFKACMCSSNEEMRESASELVAFLAASSFDDEELKELIDQLKNHISRSKFEAQHGSILSFGYLVGRILAQNRLNDLVKKMPALPATVEEIGKLLDSSSNMIVHACCKSLGEIGRNGPLPTSEGDETDEGISKYFISKKLVDMLESSKVSAKTKEKAALAAGYICSGDKNFAHTQLLIDGLFSSAKETPGIDIHFAVGEALSCIALRGSSPCCRDVWAQTVEEFESSVQSNDLVQESLGKILDEILQKHVVHTKLSIRQASSVWLLILLSQCKKNKALLERLMKIQTCMLTLLGDSNDIIQEFASKALSTVYEYGDEAQKQSLVSVLVETLTKGKKSTQRVDSETEVFQKGSLGTDTLGGSLSTYKDLCSLATDLNQPDLVYKFMHLANHNAIWNSKKGAAFGFQSIAELAGEKLTKHLPKILPKLYRYTFDPNTKARLSFSSIWSSLVPETQKTVDTYFDEIMVDVIENLTNNQWRVREACCAAVSDLLRGRNSDQILKYIPQLWEICFRVRDDIKESVRIAADSTLKTLNKVSIKLCDANNGNDDAINVILPCLLKTGLSSPAEEVKAISLKTITELSRSAGKLLRPHIPLLFVALLESLSTQESSALNMISVRLGNNQDTQQKLDTARIAASKSSPMMDTINYCIQFVDSSILPELVARLVDIIKNSVGLSTKAGSVQIVVYLVHHCPQELNAHAGKIMAALLNGVADRNAALRSCYANALGNLVKCAKDNSVEKLLSRIQEWYIEKNDSTIQESCGAVLQSMVRYSPDVVKAHGSNSLPLAFYAMHAIRSNKDEKNIWEDVWNDMSPGTEAGIRLYLSEIILIIRRGFESQSWALKSQSGRSMCTIAKTLTSNLPSQQFYQMIKILVSSLSGRTWMGKETILEAIAALSVNCKNSWNTPDTENGISKTGIVEALLKECRKENIVYKSQALKALAEVLNSLELDNFSEVYDIVIPILQKVDNKKDDDDQDDESDKKSQADIISSCFKVLGQAWPNVASTQAKYEVEFCKLLVSNLETSTWKTHVVILTSLFHFLNRWRLIQKDASTEDKNQVICYDLVNRIVPSVCNSLVNMKYSVVKLEAMKVTKLLITNLKELNEQPLCVKISSPSLDKLMKSLQSLSSDTNPELKSEASELLSFIIKV